MQMTLTEDSHVLTVDKREKSVNYHGGCLDDWDGTENMVKTIESFFKDEDILDDEQIKEGYRLKISFNTCPENSPIFIDHEEIDMEYKSELLYYIRIALGAYYGHESKGTDVGGFKLSRGGYSSMEKVTEQKTLTES